MAGELAAWQSRPLDRQYTSIALIARLAAGEHGRLVAFGVECTGSSVIGLARFLRNHGQTVREAARPPRRGERRMSVNCGVLRPD